jgi:DNA-binding transcriptional LysR family regulator
VDLGMRFLHDEEIDENAVLVMPEMLLPLSNPRYHEIAQSEAGRAHGDTVIVMDDEERGWHERFHAFAKKERHAAGMLSFNDYAIVVQAALLGQGIALGWLNVTSHWLAQGTLVPAEEELIVTSRRCCLLTPSNRPVRPIVADVRAWIIQEALSDMRIVESQYPRLGLREALLQTGIELG